MIEIATGVRERYDPLLAELRQMQGLLLRARDWLNIVLCGGGAHRSQMWSERRIFRKPRFKEVSAFRSVVAHHSRSHGSALSRTFLQRWL